ncbi:hypothetical protein TGMAS_233925 [Toxoplasma gondii MAS]|uniref:Uncharacterized protein n=1 Tax=Toxoplasma gondii MAS TaxID=943118 RepID=A0A086QX35_TOXGO|nr:hypothetical protein TGMAS_233925 [Toxoplasma gondii MAS]
MSFLPRSIFSELGRTRSDLCRDLGYKRAFASHATYTPLAFVSPRWGPCIPQTCVTGARTFPKERLQPDAAETRRVSGRCRKDIYTYHWYSGTDCLAVAQFDVSAGTLGTGTSHTRRMWPVCLGCTTTLINLRASCILAAARFCSIASHFTLQTTTQEQERKFCAV